MQEETQEVRPTLREERAEVTRRRIAAAALALFASDGYGATTIRTIAKKAGVAVQTVYAVYRSKAGILDALREGVVHDPAAETLFISALQEPPAARRLGLFARSIRQRWEHGANVILVHQDAALSDPAIRAGVERALARRQAGLERLADTLAPDLAAGIGVPEAVALLDGLTLPELWLQLVGVHGWTADEYEAWLRRTLIQQLLDTPDERDDPDPEDALAALASLQSPTGDLEQMLAEIDAGHEG